MASSVQNHQDEKPPPKNIQNEIIDFQVRLSQMEQDLKISREAKSKADLEIKRLQNENANHVKKNVIREQEDDQLTKALADLTLIVGSSEDEVPNDGYYPEDEELSPFTKQLRRLSKKVRNLKAKFTIPEEQKLAKERHSLEHTKNDFDFVAEKRQIDQLIKKKIEKLDCENKCLTKSNNDLAWEIDDLLKEKEDFIAEIDRHKTQINELNYKMIDSIKVQCNLRRQLEQQSHEQKRQTVSLNAKLVDLERKLKTERESHDKEKIEHEYGSCSTLVKYLTDSGLTYQMKIKELESKLVQLNIRIKEVTKSEQHFRDLSTKSEARVSSLEEQLDNYIQIIQQNNRDLGPQQCSTSVLKPENFTGTMYRPDKVELECLEQETVILNYQPPLEEDSNNTTTTQELDPLDDTSLSNNNEAFLLSPAFSDAQHGFPTTLPLVVPTTTSTTTTTTTTTCFLNGADEHKCINVPTSFSSAVVKRDTKPKPQINQCLKKVCQVCNKRFSSKSNLKQHIKNVHLKLGRRQCDICQKIIYTASNLRRHKLKFHEG